MITAHRLAPAGRLALIAPLLLFAPAARAERLPIRSYTTADGLANDHVDRIVQDRHGFFWFCTQEGLSRFDGYAFTTFGRESGLPSLEVLDFLEAGDGEYWIATANGLCRFESSTSRCRAQPLGEGGVVRRVQALLKDAHGRLWVGTNLGLFRSGATGDRAFQEVVLDGSTGSPRISALAEGGDGSLWVGTGVAVWRILPDGRSILHPTGGGEPSEVTALHADALGRTWIGHLGPRGGVTVFASLPASGLPSGALPLVRETLAPPSCHEDLSLTPGQACIVTQPPFPRQAATRFSASSDGALWASTLNAGLLRFETSGVRRYSVDQGLRSNALHSVLEDRTGDLWVGSESQGVMRWSRRGLVSYGQADGLSPSRIVSVFTGPTEDVYALNTRSLLNRVVGSGFESVQPNVEGSITMRFAFGPRLALQDRSGDWWIASNQGLLRFSGVRRFRDLARARPTTVVAAGTPVGPVFEDSRGDVWAAADGRRLLRWQRATGGLRSYLLPDDLPPGCDVTAFAEGRSGRLFVGLGDEGGIEKVRGGSSERGGLVRVNDDRAELVAADGLPPEPDVRWLHVDAAGRLWVAAGRGGLLRIDDPDAARPRVVAYARAEGLSSELVRCVAEDRAGRIYAGTDMGVDRLEVSTGRIEHWGVAEGLVAGDVVSAVEDAAGRLWFGTLAGISMLRPEEEPAVTLPAVRIMSLRIGGVSRPLPLLGTFALQGVELSAEESPIEIAFAGVAPAPGWERMYRLRLQGADRDWSDPTRQHSVNYARLAPGEYRFQVQAWSPRSGMGSPPSSVAFRVLAPLWRRSWFVASIALLAALLAYAAFRYRLRMLLEVERVRAGIAMDLHDDVGSSLSKIAILAEVARGKERKGSGAPEQTLASIAQISRELVDSLGDIVWAVNPRRDSLTDLAQRMRAFATEIFSAKDVALRFTAPPDGHPVPLRADLRRQAYLIFKEAVNNAASHSGCREVAVDLRLHGDWLELRVADDGRGIPRDAGEGGHGLDSMSRRAAAMGGTLDLRSQPGGGTTVTLRVRARR